MAKTRANGKELKHPYLLKGFIFDCDIPKPKDRLFSYDRTKQIIKK